MAQDTRCKICDGLAPLFGVVDFTRNVLGVAVPLSGIPVYYNRCRDCGFIFTELCDGWTPGEFATRIYNDEYGTFDPEYYGARQARDAQNVLNLFAAQKSRLSAIDIGGGGGHLARHLREGGFARAETYDPFSADFAEPPAGKFNLVTCFEVIEHVTAPRAMVETWKRFMEEDSIVLFTTGIGADNQANLDWSYIGPRNGHISVHSATSLATLVLGADLHFGLCGFLVACKRVPDFAAHFVATRPGSKLLIGA